MATLQDKVERASATRIDEVAATADREIATAAGARWARSQTRAATAGSAPPRPRPTLALIRAALASGQPFAEPLARARRAARRHGARRA